jgi:hypothetical protein
MRSCSLLFFGTLFVCVVVAAQTVATPPTKPAWGSSPEAAISPTAELALDAAKRWTQVVLDDAANLPAVEHDLLLVRLARTWNEHDHARAEEYLKRALDHFEADPSTRSDSENAATSDAISDASSDVMAVDRNAWNRLMAKLPPADASDAISSEAADLASNDDPEGAIELERKSLEHGGSGNDAETLDSLTRTNKALASTLFDDIMKTAAKPDANPSLLESIVRIGLNRPPEGDSFFNQERQQRVLDLVAQRTLAGKENGGCDYSSEAPFLMSRFSPAIQGQIQPIVEECKLRNADSIADAISSNLLNPDELARAMSATSDVKVKIAVRMRAAGRAAYEDQDYERAIRLCLEASPQERDAFPSFLPFDRFDSPAVRYALEGARAAVRKQNQPEMHRLLNVLPPGLRADVEVSILHVGLVKDKPQSLLMLADARNTLEHELPLHTITYFFMLGETAQLAPEDVNTAWRVLGSGLNHFDQRMKAQTTRLGGKESRQPYPYGNPMQPWPLLEEELVDEGFVRAIVEDLNSPEFRSCLRLSVIQAFMARYSEALKRLPASHLVTAGKTAKN